MARLVNPSTAHGALLDTRRKDDIFSYAGGLIRQRPHASWPDWQDTTRDWLGLKLPDWTCCDEGADSRLTSGIIMRERTIMASSQTNDTAPERSEAPDRAELNRNLAQMLKGGVIMDVTTPDQARVAEDAGACAVMALERIPADIRAAGGVSRMSDPAMIHGIQKAVSIPVMAKVRIGHIVEARILQAIDIDYIDESEVLSPADDVHHIDKTRFSVPFVCGAKNLGEALRRIAEGASMIRTKGEPGTGDVIQAVRHMRTMNRQIRQLAALRDDEVFETAKELAVPLDLARYVHGNGRLPVVNFAAGGIATPADAALMMELGAEGVFVGSGIFKSGDPTKRAAAIVQATADWRDSDKIARLSENLGEAMVGINEDEITTLMAKRGE